MTPRRPFRLPRWPRRTPGTDVLARWQVEPAQWQDFIAMENQRSGDPEPNILPSVRAANDGVEVVVEADGIWVAGKRIPLPLRGAPEVLSADLHAQAGMPDLLELRLKHPAYATPNTLVAARYLRLRLPIAAANWRDARKVAAHFNRDVPGTPDIFHGRGDGSDPEDLSRCWSCGHETWKFRSECERCGASLQSRRWSRRFGVVLSLCGLVITTLMGVVLSNVLPMLLHPGVDIDGSRFSGDRGTALLVLALLGAVFAFGVTALGYGAWQVATGKRSRRIAMIMVTAASGMFTLASLMAWLGD